LYIFANVHIIPISAIIPPIHIKEIPKDICCVREELFALVKPDKNPPTAKIKIYPKDQLIHQCKKITKV